MVEVLVVGRKHAAGVPLRKKSRENPKIDPIDCHNRTVRENI
jgi:hypothetical protein